MCVGVGVGEWRMNVCLMTCSGRAEAACVHVFIAKERGNVKTITHLLYEQEAGSSSGTGSSMSVHRKESVKRRAECTSVGANAKRRAVHQSPDNTPTSSKKGKRRSGLFRRKAKKGRLFMWLLFTEISSA